MHSISANPKGNEHFKVFVQIMNLKIEKSNIF
jgi:hypothetical protein